MKLLKRLGNIVTLRKFHNWYDEVKEPFRLILCLLFASPLILQSMYRMVLGNNIYIILLLPTMYLFLTRIFCVHWSSFDNSESV